MVDMVHDTGRNDMPRKKLGASAHRFSATALATTIGFVVFLVADAEQGGLSAIQGFFLAAGATLLVLGVIWLVMILASGRGETDRGRAPAELHRSAASSG